MTTDTLNTLSDYPFGMIMPGRSFNQDDNWFGFNGQENTNEIRGDGNHIDFKYRGHDPRLIRFWSVDPLFKNYPYNSTYAFAENSPIMFIDLEGKERLPAEQKSDKTGYTTAIDNTYRNTITLTQAVQFDNFNPNYAEVRTYEPNLFAIINTKLNVPSSNFLEGTLKFGGRMVYGIGNDAFIYTTGLIYGRSAATDLANFGVTPKEYQDAGINSITQIFPMERLATSTIGELKPLGIGYSQYLSRSSKSLFNKMPVEVKKTSYYMFMQKQEIIVEGVKQYDLYQKSIGFLQQAEQEVSNSNSQTPTH